MKIQSDRLFPQGKIILHDGRMLECYPLAKQTPEKIEHDPLELDKTGQYLILGRQKHAPALQPSANVEQQRQLFISNAFYLLAHQERILSDSRMFLCPIAIQNGLAYTGTSGFHNPTLGIYLEWWSVAKGTMRTDCKGSRSLVYQIAGSPLSGSNRCGAVRQDGKTETVSLSPFIDYWPPFLRLNQRYTEAKQLYQAYTLQEVLDILHQEDNGNTDFGSTIDLLFMKHEIDVLKKHIEQIKEECDMWYNKYTDALTRYNEEKMRQLYADYEVFEGNVSKEIDRLKEQKRDLKANLKRGRLDNIAYQRHLTPLKQRINDLLAKISYFKYDRVRETFPDEKDINFSMIETFVRKH